MVYVAEEEDERTESSNDDLNFEKILEKGKNREREKEYNINVNNNNNKKVKNNNNHKK